MASARVFPRLLGSCGHIYASEYVVPFQLDSFFYGPIRSRILMHLLGTLKLLHDFLNEPLHWCDVSFENFGLHTDSPKRFLIIDGDTVFTETRMSSIFNAMSCEQDSDCRFYDCTAKCIPETKRCGPRHNDNVEVFCKKLVYELYGNFWTRANKLLETCHDLPKLNSTERIRNFRFVWAWSMSDI